MQADDFSPEEIERELADETPQNQQELANYILLHADRIYVREQVNGKWGSFALTELPVKDAMKHAMRFIVEGRLPVVARSDL